MIVEQYMHQLRQAYEAGDTTEHSFRPALHTLFSSLDENITAINEPKQGQWGAPDFAFKFKLLQIGHAEAKNINVDLQHLKDRNLEQKSRYLAGFPNLLYTNGLDFEFYRDGELYKRISVGRLENGIQQAPENFDHLEAHLKDFVAQRPLTIRSTRKLSALMAGKTKIVKYVFANALKDSHGPEAQLWTQYQIFREQLIHDISPDEFADIYAETIAYGMFAARLHDDTREDFSRHEALDLLPKSNPFLKGLFSYIAGPELHPGLEGVVEDLANIFQTCDVQDLMKDFGSLTGRKDPFLHFYEDFLKEYNPEKRDLRGVWYTPEAVVNYLVRAVDDVLKSEFGLTDGLADTSKISIDWDTGQKELTQKGTIAKSGKNAIVKRDVHRVQILDPATGTGTFLGEAIKQIASRVKATAPGMWASYVENDLIPRLHGFELLMASYAMCHMKLDMILTELGYKPTANPRRLSVYLTNSLEEGEAANQTLPFAQWLSNEAKEANAIKRDMPIMCIIGNPPYKGESTNKGEWIMGLMEAYKREPGGREKLKERNPKWINDDYVKFIRMSEHMIEKNGEGILAFITNHGYLDNPTFRGMRWHLLKTFDKIYVMDLHGNTKKKEVCPDGSPDKNVFDIRQGVSLIVAAKTTPTDHAQPTLADIYHRDLWGSRAEKYEELWQSNLESAEWTKLQLHPPHYAFLDRDFRLEEKYLAGFAINEFMPINSVGIVTARDALCIDMDREKLWGRVVDFTHLEAEELRAKYSLGKDVRDWTVSGAKQDVQHNLEREKLTPITYRPFDGRWTYYTGNSRGFMCYPRHNVMRNFFKENLAMVICRQNLGQSWHNVLISDRIGDDSYVSNRSKERGYYFPLYEYPQATELDQTRRVNFDHRVWARIRDAASDTERDEVDEIATFDYIYGVLHSPKYRETYAEFLKSDFPRIPYPESAEVFWHVAGKGAALRKLHLMNDTVIGETNYKYDGHGSDEVSTIKFQSHGDGTGKVKINSGKYFDDVPEVAWTFYIGGYQPAQKWLKDRKGRTLTLDDVRHYLKIIKILSETDRIMKEIDLPL